MWQKTHYCHTSTTTPHMMMSTAANNLATLFNQRIHNHDAKVTDVPDVFLRSHDKRKD